MTEYRIFLASSISEAPLQHDRNAIGNLIRRINDALRSSGQDLYLRLFMCEMEDATMQLKRKQDSYNDFIRDCHLFVGLFCQKFGDFTLEELEIARSSGRQILLLLRTAEEGGVPVLPQIPAAVRAVQAARGAYADADQLLWQLLQHLQDSPVGNLITVSGGVARVAGVPVLLNVPQEA